MSAMSKKEVVGMYLIVTGSSFVLAGGWHYWRLENNEPASLPQPGRDKIASASVIDISSSKTAITDHNLSGLETKGFGETTPASLVFTVRDGRLIRLRWN